MSEARNTKPISENRITCGVLRNQRSRDRQICTIRTANRIRPSRLFAVSRPSPARNHGSPRSRVPTNTTMPSTGATTTAMIEKIPTTATTAYRMPRLAPMNIRRAPEAIARMPSAMTSARLFSAPPRESVMAGMVSVRRRLEPRPLDVQGEPREVGVLSVDAEPLQRERIVAHEHGAVDGRDRREKARLAHHLAHGFVEVADTAAVRVGEVQHGSRDVLLDQR